MNGASRSPARTPWGLISIYGSIMAVLVVILKYAEYRFWVHDLRVELYVGMVAVLFTALGIWVGSRLIGSRKLAVIATGSPIMDASVPERSGLSNRELEVLGLMAEGRSNQEIADRLFISLPTVKSHSSNVYSKLEVKRRTEAVHKARSLGIIP